MNRRISCIIVGMIKQHIDTLENNYCITMEYEMDNKYY